MNIFNYIPVKAERLALVVAVLLLHYLAYLMYA